MGRIAMAPPSTGAGARIEEFEIRLSGPVEAGGLRVDVRSPAGSAEGRLRLDEAERESIRAWFERVRDDGRPSRQPTPEQIGEQLFRALLGGPPARVWAHMRGRLGGAPGIGLRLVLHHGRPDPHVSALLALPWELLYDPDALAFVSGPRVSIVRRVEGEGHHQRSARAASPLRILAAWAQPPGLERLALEREWRLLERAAAPLRAPRWLRLLGADAVVLESCAQATLPRLRSALLGRPPDVWHFMGHGGWDATHGEGGLRFEDPDLGAPHGRLARGSLLAANVADVDLRLVVLNACGLAGPRAGAFRSVAETLARGGVPAVVAMQAPCDDDAALEFTRTFYDRLLAGEPAEAALHEARLALRNAAPDALDWAVPALYVRTSAGPLVEHGPWPTRAGGLALVLEALLGAWLAFVLEFVVGSLQLVTARDWLWFNVIGVAACCTLGLRWRLRTFLDRTHQLPPLRLRVPAWLAGAALRMWLLP